METWKLLLIVLLAAVLLGCIVGVLIGKHQVKVKSGHYKPLLSIRERIIYSACIVLGACCIAFALVHNMPGEDAINGGEMGEMGGMVEGDPGIADNGMPGGDIITDDGAIIDPAAGEAIPEGEANPGTDEPAANGEDQPAEGDADAESAAESAAEGEADATVDEPIAGGEAATGTTAARPRSAPRVASGGGGTVVVMG